MAEALLILGGTADARDLAGHAVARWPDVRVITSLAGRTRLPRLPKGEIRVGGFGGAAGLADYMTLEGVTCLIDATHPFAAEISRNATEAAETAKVPRLVLHRPPWRFPNDAGVVIVSSSRDARDMLSAENRRVFLAIGRQEVDAFTDLDGRFFLLRFIDPPAQPATFADCYVLTGRPGDGEAERAILKKFRIDTLIAKNGGSSASRAKIDVAIELGIKVVLIDPPAPPPPPRVKTVDAALDWLEYRFRPSF